MNMLFFARLETAGFNQFGPQPSQKMCYTQKALLLMRSLDTKMASGAWGPRPITLASSSRYKTLISSSHYKTFAALLKPSQPQRRTQRQRMATIAPPHHQRPHMFPKHRRSHRLRTDACPRVATIALDNVGV